MIALVLILFINVVDYMCAPLHRSGFLCSKCKDGFGPSIAVMGHANLKQCYKCREAWIGAILYLFLEFVPITVLFTIFLVFRISVTSAPMTCFVMYSQIIILGCYKFWPDCSIGDTVFTETGTLRTVSKIFLTFYGFLNSEFFVHIVPPFCINRHLQLIHVALLGYISAFYPMLLVILTWLCIDLHDRNCQIIVCAWKPFHPCFVRLRRSWDIKNDITDTFASLFLLSFSKILYQANLLLSTDLIFYRSLTQYQTWPQYVLGSDPNIEMGSVIFYTIYGAVGLISFIFSFLPVIILSFYPFRSFRRLLSKLRLDCIGLSIFVEKFHYCYRDGLDQGKDMRTFSGFYFLVRILVVLIPQLLFTTLGLEIWLVRGTTFLFAALPIALCRPYKRTYMNVSDTFLLSHLALLCHIVSSNTKGVRIRVLLQIVILTPFAIFLLFLIIRVLSRLCTARFQRYFFHLKACLKSNVGACAKQEGLNQPVANYGAMVQNLM